MNEVVDVMQAPCLTDRRSEPVSVRIDSRADSDTSPQFDEELVVLVHQVFLRDARPTGEMVMFAGVEHGVGCSLMASSTALLLARHAGSVCFVEANFRSPSLAKKFNVADHPGLVDALETDGSFVDVARSTDDDRLWVIPAGSVREGVGVLLTPDRLLRMAHELRNRFRYVIVDAAPLTCYETKAIAQAADSTVMVLEAGRTRRDAALAASDGLRSIGVKLAAAVLNKRTFPIPARVYRSL